MPHLTDNHGNRFPISDELLESIHAIHEFISLFSQDRIDDDIRQIAADMVLARNEPYWTEMDRRYIHFVRYQLGSLSKAMLTIDKELGEKITG